MIELLNDNVNTTTKIVKFLEETKMIIIRHKFKFFDFAHDSTLCATGYVRRSVENCGA